MAIKKAPLKKNLPSVTVRIYGVPAVRLVNLSKRTSIKKDGIAQMVAECGISAVEKRFR